MEIAKKFKKDRKGSSKHGTDAGDDNEIEMALLCAHDTEQKEISEETGRGRCVDAPKDKGSSVVGIRIGVTEFTSNPKAHRRTVEYLKTVLTKSYKSKVAHLTSSTTDKSVTACLFVQKTTAIPLANAVKDESLLALLNDAYLMHVKHPNVTVNPRRPDRSIRLAKSIQANPNLGCCLCLAGAYRQAYDALELTYITCPDDLTPFDSENRLRALVFPSPESGDIAGDLEKGKDRPGKKKKKSSRMQPMAEIKDDIIAYLSMHDESGASSADIIDY